MNKPKLPILGQPVFKISENSFDERVQLIGERGFLNSLTYFAADAIMVKKLEYETDKMDIVIINKDMVDSENPDKKIEIKIDLKREKEDHLTIFVDEIEAQRVAKQMNINQQKQCKKLVDAVNIVYNEYDKVIALCSVK
jgi:hypothetical protein